MLDLSRLAAAVQHEGCVSRRLFLAYGMALSSLPLLATRASAAPGRVSFPTDPFTLGVASGDPGRQSVVLWTRLAPEPLDPYGGMAPQAVNVRWEIAEDEQMRNVVKKGTALATPQLAHSVHAEVDGLKPDRWYWYRFRAGDAESPVGRTRTLPRRHAAPRQMRFAFASCQHYESGYFTAYKQMATDDLDLVFHLGDYIYEAKGRPGGVRQHPGDELESLQDYRVRHSLYRGDPLLQKMHALCPWLVTWDDHEFDNNYAAVLSEELDVDPVQFLTRRAAAYQAYYEMMPLRRRSLPRGPHLRLYRKAPFGRLAEFFVLDTRQYRTDQPNDDQHSPLNEAAFDRSNSLLGADQRHWLQASLLQSRGTWNVLAQQVMMQLAEIPTVSFDLRGYSMDQWPGAAYERMDLLTFLQDRRVPNPVVLTGDIHSNWVNDLRIDDRRGDDPVVATEFVGTSISSGGKGSDRSEYNEVLMAVNPGVKFHNAQRGYVRCTLTPETWTTDLVQVDDVTQPDSPIRTRATFVVEAGQPGAKPA